MIQRHVLKKFPTFAIRPWMGIPLSNPDSENPYSFFSSGSNSPLAFEISATQVIDDEHRLHFSLEGGRNFKATSYGTSTYMSTDHLDIYAARLTAAYELRLSNRSGLTFWISPALVSGKENRFYSSFNSGSYLTSIKGAIQLGMGYHYWREHFGISVGLAAGPGWEKSEINSSDFPYVYSSTSIDGALTGGINYRI